MLSLNPDLVRFLLRRGAEVRENAPKMIQYAGTSLPEAADKDFVRKAKLIDAMIDAAKKKQSSSQAVSGPAAEGGGP